MMTVSRGRTPKRRGNTRGLWFSLNALLMEPGISGSAPPPARDRLDKPLVPIEQRGSECPSPDRKETRKPGVRNRSPIGPCPVFETCFGQQFLISAMRLGGGSNVVQYFPGPRPVCIGSREFIIVQHPVREFDLERPP